MRSLMRASIFLSLTFISSCGREVERDSVCGLGEGMEGYVCAVPYELLYSDRDYFFGRNVQVDGVLIKGVVAEPPGKESDIVLFFPSAERAAFCNKGNAIKIVGYLHDDPDNVDKRTQKYTSIVGEFSVSREGYWGEIILRQSPSPLFVPGNIDIDCMRLPPTASLEQESKAHGG